MNHLHSFSRFFSRLMCNYLIQWLFQIGAKSLQYSIRNRYIQRTICFSIWLFFERFTSAHFKNSLNETNSYTQQLWWIIWETSGLPTRDTIYMLNMTIENKIYSITFKTKWNNFIEKKWLVGLKKTFIHTAMMHTIEKS